MQVTATEAKNRFGYLCSQAKAEPVYVEKGGRVDTVIVSIEEFQAMKAAAQPKSMSQRQKEFNERYKDWIADQNRVVEEHGVFGEEWRVW
ncbi:MAG: type II toxin-antitoxin system Phd/YefM family antitoxin [Burkholderiaceae bacterium]|nr:type II toxin-antitoxin system Phd/YefM family antitoxin [Burkholderiaceae bacterium]